MFSTKFLESQRSYEEQSELLLRDVEEIFSSIGDIYYVNTAYDMYAEAVAKAGITHGHGFTPTYLALMMPTYRGETLGRILVLKDGSVIPFTVFPNKTTPPEVSIYFVSPVGKDIGRVLIHLRDLIRTAGIEETIYVKKINLKNAYTLMDNEFSDITVAPWHEIAVMEDDTYPEVIIDPSNERLAKLTDYVFGSEEEPKSDDISTRSGLGSDAKKARRLMAEPNNAEFVADEYEVKKQGTSIIMDYFTRFPGNKLSSAEEYLRILKLVGRPNIIAEIVKVQGIAVGILMLETFGDTLNVYALIGMREKGVLDGVAGLLTFRILDIARNMGCGEVNFGGSETIGGVRTFLDKYEPLEAERKYTWVVDKE